eukprot:gene19965-21920_t
MRSTQSAQELSFSIKRILEDDKDDKRSDKSSTSTNTTNNNISEIDASNETMLDKSHHSSCNNKGCIEDQQESFLLLPWQIFNKQTSRRIGHPYQSRATPKRKKPRTSFTRSQISELEELFTEKKYLTSSERQRVAACLQLTDCQVKTWFQNRRTKWKRETDEEKEEQRHALRRAMITFQHKDRVIPYQNCL